MGLFPQISGGSPFLLAPPAMGVCVIGIQNFPASLQPIIQQGFLEQAFEDALRSKLAYRAVADRQEFSIGIGETLTKTRAGLKPSVTTPLNATSNTNLDNGLAATFEPTEQFTITINQYAATTDLNMVTSRVGIANQFLVNAKINGEQAARSLDELARNALFNAYMGGNTRVRTTLGGNGINVSVDDIRGFQMAPGFPAGSSAAAAIAAGALSPTLQPVSATNTLAVTVGSNVYTLVGVAADATNVSSAILAGGISGVLTFGSNVTIADGTANNAVVALIAPTMFRPSSRSTTQGLLTTDTLTISTLLNGVAQLRLNNVPDIDGLYNCYLDPQSMRQLFSDADFKQLFTGAELANSTIRRGLSADAFGLRFIPTTEAYVTPHPTIAGATVRRPIIAGMGALIEGDYAGMAASDIAPTDSIVNVVDGVAMVTREPLDRLQQIIAQSWYWIGGFCAPTDVTTNSLTVPTASNAALKRAVVIEHAG